MKKIMNDAGNFVNESLNGILEAYPEFYRSCDGDIRAIARKEPLPKGKVAIVTGGGYGHLPVFLGYVGEGLCDGVAVGNVFTSPSSDSIMNVSRGVENGGGILYLFGNYTGDGMNFAMSKEMLMMDDIESEIVTVADDLASAPRSKWEERRGIAGIAFAYKLAGACAAEMKPLAEVAALAKKTIEHTSTFGVAFSSCILPEVGKPIFTLGEDEMEIGMGIHGEPGIHRGKMARSEELAATLVEKLAADQALAEGDEIAVLVNGLGATSREELFILYADVKKLLLAKGVKVAKVMVGEYATSLEMAGASVTILKLDAELKHYLDAPAYSPLVAY